MREWIRHTDGDKCPAEVSPETFVEVRDANGRIHVGKAECCEWSGIVEYRFPMLNEAKDHSEPRKTLLDEYAMAALPLHLQGPSREVSGSAGLIAKSAYDIAEALLSEKQKREER